MVIYILFEYRHTYIGKINSVKTSKFSSVSLVQGSEYLEVMSRDIRTICTYRIYVCTYVQYIYIYIYIVFGSMSKTNISNKTPIIFFQPCLVTRIIKILTIILYSLNKSFPAFVLSKICVTEVRTL
jgi:hypothetical protein